MNVRRRASISSTGSKRKLVDVGRVRREPERELDPDDAAASMA